MSHQVFPHLIEKKERTALSPYAEVVKWRFRFWAAVVVCIAEGALLLMVLSRGGQ